MSRILSLRLIHAMHALTTKEIIRPKVGGTLLLLRRAASPIPSVRGGGGGHLKPRPKDPNWPVCHPQKGRSVFFFTALGYSYSYERYQKLRPACP